MKKVLYFFIFSLSFSAVNDIDGNTYETVRIGNQFWIKQNLKVTHFSNGDEILTNIPSNEWVDDSFSGGAYTLYNNDDIYFITYGNLYSWYAVNDSRGICMDGWRVPSDDDWKELETYLGMSTAEVNDVGNRGLDEGAKLKESGYSHWIEASECYNDQLGAVECIEATNETEFTAVPNGYCFGHTYGCESLGSSSHFWSSTHSETTDGGDKAWSRILNKYSAQIDRYSAKKNYAFAVRCVQDVVEGCMDMNACNYDIDATEDDGSCEYPEDCYDCDNNCVCHNDCNGDCGGSDLSCFTYPADLVGTWIVQDNHLYENSDCSNSGDEILYFCNYNGDEIGFTSLEECNDYCDVSCDSPGYDPDPNYITIITLSDDGAFNVLGEESECAEENQNGEDSCNQMEGCVWENDTCISNGELIEKVEDNMQWGISPNGCLFTWEDEDEVAILEQIPADVCPSYELEGSSLTLYSMDYGYCMIVNLSLYSNVYQYGDVTMDGIIDILDAIRVVAIIMDNWDPTDTEFLLADMNSDGIIDILDAIQIVQIIIS